jgi:non-ribosomal peptide synthetase component F
MSLNEAVNFYRALRRICQAGDDFRHGRLPGAVCRGDQGLRRFLGAPGARTRLLEKPFTQVLDESDAPFFKWFADGTLNASYNCLDRNVEAGLGDKVAIVFEADDGEVTRSLTELLSRVSLFANGLRARGIKKGDRVVIYMSMGVEGIVAMQACARIGAIHSVVFGGFSAQSVRDRINDAGAVAVITADEQCRGGKKIPLKPAVDDGDRSGWLRVDQGRDRLPAYRWRVQHGRRP